EPHDRARRGVRRARGDVRHPARPASGAGLELRRLQLGQHRPGDRHLGVSHGRRHRRVRRGRGRHRGDDHRQRDRHRHRLPGHVRAVRQVRRRAVHDHAQHAGSQHDPRDRLHLPAGRRDGLDGRPVDHVRPGDLERLERGARHQHRAEQP
ncbi:MAG: hypothetical protein AVDCRST_MAG79-522, partial [uncultured Thermoleophilia bacterium]